MMYSKARGKGKKENVIYSVIVPSMLDSQDDLKG